VLFLFPPRSTEYPPVSAAVGASPSEDLFKSTGVGPLECFELSSFTHKGVKTMSDLLSKNKDLMRRIYEEMWNGRNPDLASELFAQPEGVTKFARAFLTSFPDLQHTVEEIIAEADQVAVRFAARGTHSGPWLDFAPSGRSIHYTGVTLARIAGDKIVEHHTWWDKAGLIEQVGRR
jgi:predicted ester cyclase